LKVNAENLNKVIGVGFRLIMKSGDAVGRDDDDGGGGVLITTG
jgi:hypothetical protein